MLAGLDSRRGGEVELAGVVGLGWGALAVMGPGVGRDDGVGEGQGPGPGPGPVSPGRPRQALGAVLQKWALPKHRLRPLVPRYRGTPLVLKRHRTKSALVHCMVVPRWRL